MNEQEIDKSVRDFFLCQKLPAEKVQLILEKEKPQPERNNTAWWHYWVPVAAAAAIVMAFSFQMGRSYKEDDFILMSLARLRCGTTDTRVSM